MNFQSPLSLCVIVETKQFGWALSSVTMVGMELVLTEWGEHFLCRAATSPSFSPEVLAGFRSLWLGEGERWFRVDVLDFPLCGWLSSQIPQNIISSSSPVLAAQRTCNGILQFWQKWALRISSPPYLHLFPNPHFPILLTNCIYRKQR